MVGLLVVSHSPRAAEGIVEVASEMAGDTTLAWTGGDGAGGFGTRAPDITDGLDAADDGDGVVVLVDLGSAVMNADVAIEGSEVEAVVADAPVLEGAVNAAVAATAPNATLDSVREAAEDARDIDKL
jgi:dihydroxyacetone kinase DhaKLM complex PTS-EIIA-like component DhaM